MIRTNKTRHTKLHEILSENVDQLQVFVIINKEGMRINADVNKQN